MSLFVSLSENKANSCYVECPKYRANVLILPQSNRGGGGFHILLIVLKLLSAASEAAAKQKKRRRKMSGKSPNVTLDMDKCGTHSAHLLESRSRVTQMGTEYRIPSNRLPTSSKADWPKRPVEVARPPFLAEKSFRNPTTMCHGAFGRHLEGILEGAWRVQCLLCALSALRIVRTVPFRADAQ